MKDRDYNDVLLSFLKVQSEANTHYGHELPLRWLLVTPQTVQ